MQKIIMVLIAASLAMTACKKEKDKLSKNTASYTKPLGYGEVRGERSRWRMGRQVSRE